MRHPKSLSIADFNYILPGDRIALHPLPDRDASKLLVWNGTGFRDSSYRDIAQWLPPDARMVFNDTRVADARLRFPNPGSKDIEVFVLEPADGTMLPELLAKEGSVLCRCLVGGASRWRAGYPLEKVLDSPSGKLTLRAMNKGRDADAFLIKLEWDPPLLSFADILHQAGQTPLPPYLHRAPDPADASRYQTVYANKEGSVAAPTAGLHFTEEVFQSFQAKGIRKEFVTLHVGAGTFRPVKTARMEDHLMHGEFAEVGTALLNSLMDEGGPVVAVGTTSLRTLESLYWLGVRHLQVTNGQAPVLEVGQWEPYDADPGALPSTQEALGALVRWIDTHSSERLVFRTHLIIAPGYRFRVAKGLVTNFHQPGSTLLLLVAAWMGPAWRNMYQHALDNDYRFLSYGDGCLLGLPIESMVQ